MVRGALLSLLLAIAGCQADAVSAWQSLRCGAEAETLAGRTAAPLLELRCGGVSRNLEVERSLEAVARRLQGTQSSGPCRIRLLATGGVNAYSLPGGLVYLTDGLYVLIGDDETMVAAVIAHELAHIASKDSLRPACRSAEEALDREALADAAAAKCLKAAGYPSGALVRVLEVTRNVQPPGWAYARIERLRRATCGSDNSLPLIASR